MRRSVSVPLGWTVYLLIPVAGWGLFDGVPLTMWEVLAVAGAWWAAWTSEARRDATQRKLVVALVLAKLLVATQFVDHGFLTRYYANDRFAAPHERSADVFWRSDVTRRDLRLAFGAPTADALPLWFRNDIRFNYFHEGQPTRDALPFSVTWDGYVRQDARAATTLFVRSDAGATAELLVDDRTALAPRDGLLQRADVVLEPGWHHVTVRVASHDGLTRQIQAGRIVNGQLRPFDDASARAFRPSRMQRDAIARWLARVLDAIAVVAIGWTVVVALWVAVRDRQVGRLLWLVAIADAAWFAAPYASGFLLLSGGDDWLTYEHFARAIAFGDPLLRVPGPAAGQGTPFYQQPFYPYFLALTHLVGGDRFFIMAFTQRLLLAATTGVLAATTVRLFGSHLRWPAITIAAAFLYAKGGHWAQAPLGEPFFIPMAVTWIYLVVRMATGDESRVVGLVAGLSGGLATLTRSAFLLAWPPVLGAAALASGSRRRRPLAICTAVMVGLFALVAIRNSVMATKAAYVSTSGSVVLHLGNMPPAELQPAPAGRSRFYARAGFDEFTTAVLEYAVQFPGLFVRNLGAKALYSLGFFKWSGYPPAYSEGFLAWRGLKPVPSTSWAYVAVWGLGLIGLVHAVRTERRWPLPAIVIPALAAACHLLVVIVFLPNMYGDRMILPLYPLLIPYVAYLSGVVFNASGLLPWRRLRPLSQSA